MFECLESGKLSVLMNSDEFSVFETGHLSFSHCLTLIKFTFSHDTTISVLLPILKYRSELLNIKLEYKLII